MIDHIIYQGKKFTIEWYYDDRGKSAAEDYYNELSEDRQEKFYYLVLHIGNIGFIPNKEKFRYEDDQLYVFKPQPDRFFCFFFKGSKIIVTNAFEKKSDKMPKREKERALKYKEDYEKRIKKGTYYE